MLNVIIINVTTALFEYCKKDTPPLDVIIKAVNLIDCYNIKNCEKKSIVKGILKRIAMGEDQHMGTFDDKLHENTLDALLIMVDSECIDFIIDGLVKHIHRDVYKSIINKCGFVIKIRK